MTVMPTSQHIHHCFWMNAARTGSSRMDLLSHTLAQMAPVFSVTPVHKHGQ
jgi:hypothetical protein